MNETSGNSTELDGLFKAIDEKDTETFLGYLADDATFRFGSAPPVTGLADIGGAVDGFFATIAGSHHRILRLINDESTLVCVGEVTYRRLDDSELTLPFTNIFEMHGKQIRQYKIYIDIGPLYAA